MNDVAFFFKHLGQSFKVEACSTLVLGGDSIFVNVRAFYEGKEDMARNVNQVELTKGKNPAKDIITKDELKEFDFLENFKEVIDNNFDKWYVEFKPKNKTKDDTLTPMFEGVSEGFSFKLLSLMACYKALKSK